MPRLSIFQSALCGVAAYVLMVAGLNSIGLVGPDEPRYADVAREMFLSGDYITPKLFGQPWFEKPPLYYWLAALSFHLGISEFSARFPSALFAILFLGVWYWFVDRHYQQRAAQWSCLILATSLGWIGFARAAAMDMLLTTTLSAALAFFLTWWFARPLPISTRGNREPVPPPWALYAFYAALALATLAKGPLAILLAAMVVMACIIQRRDWRAITQMLFTPAIALYAVIAIPWYVLCYSRNGWPFIEEFFVRHNIQRFTSGEALGHPQPLWFYVLILPVAIFPWSPLLLVGLLGFFRNPGRKFFADERLSALVAWIALPFVFFSASANKLPGYLLPILPPVSLMLALVVAYEPRERDSEGSTGLLPFWKKAALSATAASLIMVPLFAWILPESLATGLSTAVRQMSEHGLLSSISSGGVPTLVWILAVLLIFAAIVLAFRGATLEAGGAIAIAVCICLGGMLVYMSPVINSIASVRSVAQRAVTMGIDPQEMGTLYIHRTQVYGLGFYFGTSLPEWRPDDPNQQFSYIAARDDFKVDEFRPGAHLMARFPRQNLSLWSLPARKIPEVRVPASLRGMRN